MTRQSPAYRTNRNLFSNHYLSNRLRETDAWTEPDTTAVRDAYEEIRALYEDCADRVDDYNEAQLERNFIRPVFEALGIPFEIEETVARVNRRPDYGFFETETAADAAFDREDFYAESVAVADAKSWGRKLDTRGEKRREFENPSYQIHVYLEEAATSWAVLTNGRQWRLYYGPTSHQLRSYYEIDLPKLLTRVAEGGDEALADFRDFYLFFRREAFVPDDSGDCFLDDVYKKSNRFSENLQDDLQDNIYKAIRVLAKGFLDKNEDLDESDLNLIHDSSLIYLYRLIFVLYAESEERDLLPTDNEVYESEYSLNSQKEAVAENLDATETEYYAWRTTLWDRLDELFKLIDQGSAAVEIPPEKLQIPAYNGGLFNTDPAESASEEARFLADHDIGDQYLAQVIDLLSRQERGTSDGKRFVDYSSLDVRQLGSIYEGLLEYELHIADEDKTVDEDGVYESADEDDEVAVVAGDVYLVTDSGERKATGSYYTPEYVVEYIVEETLEPQVESIREAAKNAGETDTDEFAKRVREGILDLTVLDPAMGSGHFLVNVVNYLAREIIRARQEQDEQAVDDDRLEEIEITTDDGELRDIHLARREVAKHCLYGVDVNPLATELAKVSLWLNTLAAGKPLTFLNHHLKTGNSLVGSNIYEVLSNGDSGAQTTLEDDFNKVREQTLSHVQGLMEELVGIENDDLASIKQMQATYQEMQSDPLYRRLFELADVHTAERFGLDVPEGAYRTMAGAIESEDEWTEQVTGEDWFVSAQAMADEERFFHWELEFPEVFMNGEDRKETNIGGFDAVIGNPPWVGVRTGILDETLLDHLKREYVSAVGQFDTAAVFLEKGEELVTEGNTVGFVVPKRIATNESYDDLRAQIAVQSPLHSAIDLGVAFDGVNNDALVLIFGGEETELSNFGERTQKTEIEHWSVDTSVVGKLPFNIIPVNSVRQETEIVEKIMSGATRLERFAEVNRGAECGMNHESISKTETGDSRPIVDHLDVGPYGVDYSGHCIDLSQIDQSVFKSMEIYDEVPKLLIRFLAPDLRVAKDNEGYISTNLVYHLRSEGNIELLNGLLSSKLLSFWYFHAFQNDEVKFPHVQQSHIESIPVPNLDSSDNEEVFDKIEQLSERARSAVEQKSQINE